jgi:hypothetical protein
LTVAKYFVQRIFSRSAIAGAILMLSLMSSLILIYPVSGFAQEVGGSGESAGSGGSGEAWASTPGTAGSCGAASPYDKNRLEQMAWEVLGEEAPCYMKLFKMESGVNPACKASPPGMPHPPGVGLCMIEGQTNLRMGRGPECARPDPELSGYTEEGVKQQMKCCQELMRTTHGAYFSTVKNCH